MGVCVGGFGVSSSKKTCKNTHPVGLSGQCFSVIPQDSFEPRSLQNQSEN